MAAFKWIEMKAYFGMEEFAKLKISKFLLYLE